MFVAVIGAIVVLVVFHLIRRIAQEYATSLDDRSRLLIRPATRIASANAAICS
jgi:hypothetical protein